MDLLNALWPALPAASPGWLLAGLFISSLLAATLLPGGSEVALAALLAHDAALWPAALGLATLGNTLGSLLTYWMARLLPARQSSHRWIARHGSKALVLAWLPLVGDALCVAAGWLRLPWLPCLVWIAAGKLLRYLAIVLPFVAFQ